MPEVVHDVNAVYGIMGRGHVPLTYVQRESVDQKLLDELSREQHVVIHGSSKQGKTSLLFTNLVPDSHVTVQCGARWTKRDLYQSILKRLDVKLAETVTASSGSRRLRAELTAEATMPVAGNISGTAGVEHERSGTSVSSRYVEFDPDNANDVIDILTRSGCPGFIVIEDFHYLDVNVQREFAIDLKAFFELCRIRFIIVGVWLEDNRLLVYNGDLVGRLTSINVDTWTQPELSQVVKSGHPLLNIQFSAQVITELVTKCQKNVGFLQEAVRQICLLRGVRLTTDNHVWLDDPRDVDVAYGYLAKEWINRFGHIITTLAKGTGPSDGYVYRHVIEAVIEAPPDRRRRGLNVDALCAHGGSRESTKPVVTPDMMIEALERIRDLQIAASIQPIVFDYSPFHRRLDVVDSALLVFLANTPLPVRKTLLG